MHRYQVQVVDFEEVPLPGTTSAGTYANRHLAGSLGSDAAGQGRCPDRMEDRPRLTMVRFTPLEKSSGIAGQLQNDSNG